MSKTTHGTHPSALGPDTTTRDEDLLYPSGSRHWHTTSQAIRFPGDVSDGHRKAVQNSLDAGDIEPVPVQVTTRNRFGQAVRVRSRWDGVQLHLDICPTREPRMALRPALAAMVRFYATHKAKLAALLLAALAFLVALAIAIAGVV